MNLFYTRDRINIGFIVSLALLLNVLFLCINYKRGEYCFQTLAPHGEIAYNIAQHNAIKINPERLADVVSEQLQAGMYVDYADIDHAKYAAPSEFRDVGDTPFYGILLGLLWKISHSFRYIDLQLLQVFLFILSLCMLYRSLRMYGIEKAQALCMTLAVLLFLPLLFQNIQAHRDIWAFYGSIILFDFFVTCYRPHSIKRLSALAMLFALTQLIRPSLFFLMVGAIGYLVIMAFVYRRLYLVKAAALLASANAIFFWAPYLLHNHAAYNRLLVGPVGQDLLEGLGEYENPWGYQLNDRWYAEYMAAHYPELVDRQERDDKARELFNAAVQENPEFYLRSLVKRFFAMLLPNFAWSHYPEDLYKGCESLRDKFVLAVHFPYVMLDLLARLLVARFMLLLGYTGLLLMLWRKQYELLGMLLMIWLGAYAKFMSHIELRYLVSFYWPFALAMGSLVFEVYIYLARRFVIEKSATTY